MHGGRKTICRRVAHPDGVGLGAEFGNRADGAKDFFLHDLHVFGDIGEDGGLDEVAFFAVTVTADLDLGAFLLSSIDITVDGVISFALCIGFEFLEWRYDRLTP